jgi:hypothetical protein
MLLIARRISSETLRLYDGDAFIQPTPAETKISVARAAHGSQT